MSTERGSGKGRIVRGWATVGLGLAALAAPLLIADSGSLFVFALAPIGIFIFVAGILQIVRGTKASGGEEKSNPNNK